MNILSNLQQISNIIIRPSRYTYKVTDLGNKTFKINDKTVQRQDFQLKNPRGLKIKASIYSTKQHKNIDQVLIYLHCNSGCRIQGLAYLKLAIENDFAYVVFDFTGSGMSEGKYVSLGFYQTSDLQCVYLHLKSVVSEKAKFILWGRSMGAVTALNFLLTNKYQVFMAIFDSPFHSLKQLFIQIGRQKTSFPDFILEMAYNYLKPIILQRANFDIQKVDLKFQINSISIPGIFIASKQDTLVPFQQIDEIFNFYKGDKQMLFIEQGHNQARNIKVISDIFKSIKKQLATSELNAKIKLQRQKQKKNYFSLFGQQKLVNKQLSRKKLQLTIKSLSQRQLLTTTLGKILKSQTIQQQSITKRNISSNYSQYSKYKQNSYHQIKPSHQNSQPSIPILVKTPISCVLPHNKKSLKVLSVQEQQNRLSFQQSQKKPLTNNKSQSKLKVKRKPFQIKNFFGNQNAVKQKDLIKIQEDSIKEPNNILQSKTQVLRQRYNDNDNNSLKSPLQIKDPIKNLSAIYSSKPLFTPQSPQQSNHPKHTQKRTRLHLGQSSSKKQKQRQQPNSDIKNENHKINCHQDFIKEKQFLKRCQSLQKVFKIQQIGLVQQRNINLQPQVNQTYRQIKCTERVLEKIIQKQQRKLLILNIQSSQNQRKPKQTVQSQQQLKEPKQRKTFQHIIHKKPPFVQLKGIKNFRNSLQTKYKTEMRK